MTRITVGWSTACSATHVTSGFRLGVLRGKPCFQVPQTAWSHHLTGSDALPREDGCTSPRRSTVQRCVSTSTAGSVALWPGPALSCPPTADSSSATTKWATLLSSKACSMMCVSTGAYCRRRRFARTPKCSRDENHELGPDGGYIACSTHNLQNDTPTDNILAMYDVDSRGMLGKCSLSTPLTADGYDP